MKNLILPCLLAGAFTASAQVNVIETLNINSDVVTEQGDRFNVVADKMTFNHTERTIEYTGLESLTTEDIEICYADKVVYNINTNEIIMSGNLSMTGVPLHVEMPYKGKSRHIRYRLGDKVAYME